MAAGPILYGVLALALGACALAAQGAWLRASAFCLTLALVAALWQTSLGRPRPPLFVHPAGTVVGYRFDEPHAIYLWMVGPGEHVPTAYALPWSEHQAAQLQKAAEEAKRQGEPLKAGHTVRSGLFSSLVNTNRDSDYRFYPAQLQPLPPKAMPAN
jgi:hypothetical protein